MSLKIVKSCKAKKKDVMFLCAWEFDKRQWKKKNDQIKNVKQREGIKRSSLRCYCVFKVINIKRQ